MADHPYLRSLPERCVLRLKSWFPVASGHREPATLCGRELSRQPGAIQLVPDIQVLCLGPGEWLAISTTEAGPRIRDRVGGELAAGGLGMVDLTEGLGPMEVSGARAAELLSKGCGLDFDPDVFRPGTCARTRLAQVPVVIVRGDDTTRFELYVSRSYLSYLTAWVEDAALEYAG
ncbi:MAG TPA: sarcosine oxidase subunit gamma family protein [Steroidobacteraceae bacterium]|jgi:sarcosine oxidase subunit gamma